MADCTYPNPDKARLYRSLGTRDSDGMLFVRGFGVVLLIRRVSSFSCLVGRSSMTELFADKCGELHHHIAMLVFPLARLCLALLACVDPCRHAGWLCYYW